jgi:hypothetical protein
MHNYTGVAARGVTTAAGFAPSILPYFKESDLSTNFPFGVESCHDPSLLLSVLYAYLSSGQCMAAATVQHAHHTQTGRLERGANQQFP